MPNGCLKKLTPPIESAELLRPACSVPNFKRQLGARSRIPDRKSRIYGFQQQQQGYFRQYFYGRCQQRRRFRQPISRLTLAAALNSLADPSVSASKRAISYIRTTAFTMT